MDSTATIDATSSRELRQALSRNALIAQLAAALNASVDTREIFNIMLVAVTAGEGLGFHRAFVFLVDGWERDSARLDEIPATALIGRVAIGPAGPAEAERIWSELASDQSVGSYSGLLEAVTTYRLRSDGFDREVNERVGQSRIALHDGLDPFSDVLRCRRPRVIHRDDLTHDDQRETFERLDVLEVAAVGITSGERRLGLLMADYRFNGSAIDAGALEFLQLVADQAGNALERSHLTEHLECQVAQLQAANDQIASVQERLRDVERFALIGEITSEVAHQLRNPLAIIGGFASQLERNGGVGEPDTRAHHVIRSQVQRMERLLDRVVGGGSWEAAHRTTINIGRLLTQVLDIIGVHRECARFEYSGDRCGASTLVYGVFEPLRFGLYHLLSILAASVGPGGRIAWNLASIGDRLQATFRALPDGDSADIARAFRMRWTSTSGPEPVVRRQAVGYLQALGGRLDLGSGRDDPIVVVIDLPLAEGGIDENGADS